MACRTRVVRAEAPGDLALFEVVHNVCGQETMICAYIAREKRGAKSVSALQGDRNTKFPVKETR